MATKLKNSRVKKSAAAARTKNNTAPIPIRAIDFIMYCARDMKGTRAFYQDLFGLKPGVEWNDFWSEFDTQPVTLCLNGPSEKPEWNWQGPAAVALAVRDIHKAIDQCRRRGVKILAAPIESRVCWMAIIADPAGNRICLHQRKDGTAG